METQNMVERPSQRYKTLTRSNIGQGIKVDAPLGLVYGIGLWRLHIITVQVKRLWEFMAKGLDFGLDFWRLHTMHGRRLQFPYFNDYVFSAHFFGLSTKFGRSIPRPLDLDDHSVKRP
jgi:hypothetical protein